MQRKHSFGFSLADELVAPLTIKIQPLVLTGIVGGSGSFRSAAFLSYVKSKMFCIFLLWISLFQINASARTLYVDAQNGRDGNDGATIKTAFQRIQKAAGVVSAGDEVIIRPGIYFGPVEFRTKGTKGRPIVFRASEIGENKVVITNADAKIRSGIKWTLEDEALALYSAPFVGEWPARMLYSGVDLFPYRDVMRLKTLTADNDEPGPRHGYAFDPIAKKLYVRLHPDGKYGSTDPNKHLMAVAPATGSRFDGTFITEPHQYCFGVLGKGSASVIIDGISFETPGVAGVYLEANDVTVRRCWFKGCRTGVGGNYADLPPVNPVAVDAPYGTEFCLSRLNPASQASSASNITIEYCDFTQYPTFEDATEALQQSSKKSSIFMRKAVGKSGGGNSGLPSDHFKYEIGIAARIARGWVIRRNYVHSVLDGLSTHAVSASQGLRIEENVFEGVTDNGVECQEHAMDMHISRNVFINNFMPFAYVPIAGPPWPGPIFFTQNVILNTPEYAAIWQQTKLLGVFKFHAFYWRNWGRKKTDPEVVKNEGIQQKVPDPGLIVANNTIFFPEGRLAIPSSKGIPNQFYFNNIFAADFPDKGNDSAQFKSNVAVPATASQPGPSKEAIGEGGMALPDLGALELGKDLRPTAGSPLCGKAVAVPAAGLKLSDIGAIQAGDTWYPLKVGPLNVENILPP